VHPDASDPSRQLLLDTNVVIDLLKLDALPVVAQLQPYTLLIVAEVKAELVRPDQAETLEHLIEGGAIREVALESIEEQAQFAKLLEVVGKGEAACLAIAHHRGTLIASDETHRALMREIRRLVGEDHLVRTAALLAETIGAQLTTLDQLERRVAELTERATGARDRDDVQHLARVLDRVRGHLRARGPP